MHSYPVPVYIRKVHKHPDAFHLVRHLGLPALSVDGLFVLGALVQCASVVLHIDEITSLGHIHFPRAEFRKPRIPYKL